jgi:hypothetical protein
MGGAWQAVRPCGAVWLGNLVCNTRLLVKKFSGSDLCVLIIENSRARVQGGITVLETVYPSGRARAGGRTYNTKLLVKKFSGSDLL